VYIVKSFILYHLHGWLNPPAMIKIQPCIGFLIGFASAKRSEYGNEYDHSDSAYCVFKRHFYCLCESVSVSLGQDLRNVFGSLHLSNRVIKVAGVAQPL
jgi:hypothetical protein